MSRRRLVAAGLSLFAVAAVAVPTALAGHLHGNPANAPSLLRKPIEDFRYDYGKRCLKHPRPGTEALQTWLEQHVRGESWGIMRCEKMPSGHYSLHSEGRAIDWHLEARNRKDKHAARKLIHVLLATDKHGNYAALARRMGVQGIIFNCKDWFSGMQGLGDYFYCFDGHGRRRHHLDPTQAHRNHVHIELNWPGARKKTSFWHSRFAP